MKTDGGCPVLGQRLVHFQQPKTEGEKRHLGLIPEWSEREGEVERVQICLDRRASGWKVSSITWSAELQTSPTT